MGFIDLARALATLLMIQGHTIDVLLLPDYRTTAGFYLWSFVRGLTSCVFLFLSGFVFTVATHRGWRHYANSLRANGRRLRRFAAFLALGYVLHFPAERLSHLWFIHGEAWRSFFPVDVLQCLAISLCGLQAIVLLTRTSGRFAVATATACAAVIAVTPSVWNADGLDRFPIALASYLSPRTGSLFPIFPWAAYVLLGATVGEWYQRQRGHGSIAFANRALLPAGLAMLGIAYVGARLPFQPLGSTEFWTTSPNQFLLRAGLVLLFVGVIAHAGQCLSAASRVIRPLAQESLLVYVVHLCMVYGSPWNTGLIHTHGNTMDLGPALGVVAALWITMAVIATTWNTLKGSRVRSAMWLRLATGAFLSLRLM